MHGGGVYVLMKKEEKNENNTTRGSHREWKGSVVCDLENVRYAHLY